MIFYAFLMVMVVLIVLFFIKRGYIFNRRLFIMRRDNSGRRNGEDRRKIDLPGFVERRKGFIDRRSGVERRSGQDRRKDSIINDDLTEKSQ